MNTTTSVTSSQRQNKCDALLLKLKSKGSLLDAPAWSMLYFSVLDRSRENVFSTRSLLHITRRRAKVVYGRILAIGSACFFSLVSNVV